MGVAVDNTGASAGGTSVTSLTITSFAVGGGSNRLIFLGVSQFKSTDTAPTAVFNTSESFTSHDATTQAEGGGTRRASILYLKAPSNATANIVVSWASAVDEAVIGADSWTGVDQTTPLGTAVKNSSNNANASTVSVTGAAGDVLHDVYSGDGDSPAKATGNQTQRWRAIAAAFTTEGDGQSVDATGSAQALTWNTNIGSIVLAHIGVAIKAAAAGGTTVSGTVAESASAAEAQSAALTAVGARSETLTAADAPAATIVTAAALSETGAASDTQAGTLTTGATRAESLTPTDAPNATLTQSAAASETLTVTDAQSTALTTAGARAESVTAAESQDASVVAAGAAAVAETLTATDAPTATATLVGASAETLSAAAAQGATITTSAGRTESLTAADATSANVIAQGAVADTLAATDTRSATADLLAALDEVLAAFDTTNATGGQEVRHLDEPLSIDFTSLARAIDFDHYAKAIGFLDGGTTVFELIITQGELEPIAMVLQGADPDTGVLTPYDVSQATALTLTAKPKVGNAIINAATVAKTDAANGRVTYTPQSGETATAGIFDALIVATFPGSIVRKFPGRIKINEAIA